MNNSSHQILELIEHNERLVKIAIANSKIGEEQQTKDLIGFLTELLEIIYDYKVNQPEKYNNLILDSFQYENPLRQKEALNNDYYNQISFLSSFRSGLTGIWRQCFVSNQYIACQYLVYNIQKILTRVSSEEGNENLIGQLNLLLREILLYGIRRHDTQHAFLVGPAFQVYFNVVFNESDDRYRFKLKYLKLFDNWFWGSLQSVIYNKADKIFDSFVETIFQGHYISTLSIGRSYEYFKVLSPRIREIADLDQRIYSVSNLDEASKVISESFELVERHESEIIDGYTKEQVKAALETMIHKSLKINNLLVYIYLMGAFLVFKRRFEWIRDFWNFKQPLDADAHWGSNEILPENLTSVFKYFLHSYNFMNWVEFSWEKRHGISVYYEQYGLLLIARLFLIPKIYVYQDPTNVSYLLSSISNPSDFDAVIRVCKALKSHISIIKKSNLFPETFVKEGYANGVMLTDEVDKLLKKIISEAGLAKQNFLESQEMTGEEFDQLINQVNISFQKENQVLDIFDKVGCYAISEKDANAKELPLSIPRRKTEFNEQWRSLGSSIGFEGARNLSYRLCSLIFEKIDRESLTKSRITAIKEENFERHFVNVLQDVLDYEKPFIIGFGMNFHSLFWNNNEFTFSSGEDSNKVGEYKFHDKTIGVYNITNWSVRRSFFLVDAKSFGTFTQYELEQQGRKKFVEVTKEAIVNEGVPHVVLNYRTYYSFELLPAAKFFKVVVGNNA